MKNRLLSKKSLKKMSELNKDYEGSLQSITFIVQRGKEQKKIFKWFFQKGKVDFYVTFPYYKCKEYHCGIVKIPAGKSSVKSFNAVNNGISSNIPVKFSYHIDGNVHFKPNGKMEDKSFKLVKIKGTPLADLDGHKLFEIYFEGLGKFKDYRKKDYKNGHEEVFLPVDDDILHFNLIAYAGPTEESVSGKIEKGVLPWFLTRAEMWGRRLYIGVYGILSRRTHIIDENKNGLTVFVGFDHSSPTVQSLYLFAR